MGFLLTNRLTMSLTVKEETTLNQNFRKQIKKGGSSSKNIDSKKYEIILIHNPNFRIIKSP